MEVLEVRIPPEDDGATVRHILRAKLHFSARAISRLTRAERGIMLNGQRARTTYVLRTGDMLAVEPVSVRSALWKRKSPSSFRRLYLRLVS